MPEPTFESLIGHASVLSALQKIGWHQPTPIQAAVIPKVQDGTDLLAVAMTGSGKTGAYLIPAVAQLAQADDPPPRPPWTCLVAHTRAGPTSRDGLRIACRRQQHAIGDNLWWRGIRETA